MRSPVDYRGQTTLITGMHGPQASRSCSTSGSVIWPGRRSRSGCGSSPVR